MSYDVDTPKTRFNTEISREYYNKYRPKSEKKSVLSHWFIMKGPDSDIVLKTASGVVNGTIAGTFACIHSNAMHTKGPFSIVGIASKCYKHGTPWVVAGASYGVTLSLLTQLRGKESPFHHMVAGYAAGTMLGSWYKWPQMGVWSGGILALTAGLFKYWHDNGIFDSMPIKRQRVFNMYRRGWFMERPSAEGRDDAKIDVSYRQYRP